MGYITRFQGELSIEPPLTWAEVEASNFREKFAQHFKKDVKIRVAEQTVSTSEGVLIRRSGVALVPTWESEMRGYDIVDHVQQFIDRDCGTDHVLAGRLDCEGEETGDLWRLEVHNGRAVQVRPRIVWPDGTEEPAR